LDLTGQTFARFQRADLENENHFQDALRAKDLQIQTVGSGQKYHREI